MKTQELQTSAFVHTDIEVVGTHLNNFTGPQNLLTLKQDNQPSAPSFPLP